MNEQVLSLRVGRIRPLCCCESLNGPPVTHGRPRRFSQVVEADNLLFPKHPPRTWLTSRLIKECPYFARRSAFRAGDKDARRESVQGKEVRVEDFLAPAWGEVKALPRRCDLCEAPQAIRAKAMLRFHESDSGGPGRRPIFEVVLHPNPIALVRIGAGHNENHRRVSPEPILKIIYIAPIVESGICPGDSIDDLTLDGHGEPERLMRVGIK